MTSQPLDLNTDGCYLIHADSPLHHAQHYIGYSDCIASRIEDHKKSKGSRLVAAFNRSGISWSVVRIWPSQDRSFERKLHRGKNSGKWLCPICREHMHLKVVTTIKEPVAQFGMLRLTMKDIERVTPVVCCECYNELTAATTFYYDGLTYCFDCLPYYDKHQQW